MSEAERNGKRKGREQSLKLRIPELGYYFIVTDTKETERNYMNGLRDSIPEELQGKLVIKVIKTETRHLVEDALNMASINPQYGEPWIIFDRDQVENFDGIIVEAEKNGIHVGWANPCIEAWFHAYFGAMPRFNDSVDCCDKFAQTYLKKAKQPYKKNDADIYLKLIKYGNEDDAIKIAEDKWKFHISNGNSTPSEMSPCTTIHTLIKEIKSKIKK